jgi:hypothetical protein
MTSRLCRLAGAVAASVGLLLLKVPGTMAQNPAVAPPGDKRAAENQPDSTKSLTEVNKELSNPISSIWSLTFQQNTYWLTMPTPHKNRNQVNFQFQPVLPIALTKDWNLINRPVLHPLLSTPYINSSGNLHRVTGFGDTIFVTMLSPSDRLVGNWLLAAGPTFIFPTASNSRLGQNSGSWGRAGLWVISARSICWGYFHNSWWSVGGPGKNSTSQLNLQYFASYFFGKGWSVSSSPNMLVNWYARKGQNMLTFPVGLGLSKVRRLGILPVRFAVQGQYMPIHPAAFGQKWNIQVVIAPVIPKLIKADVLESIGPRW